MKKTSLLLAAILGFAISATAAEKMAGHMAHGKMAANPQVGGKDMSADKNIIENAVNSPIHTTLVAAVKAADLVATLSGKGPFTVFAPTDAAFKMLPPGTVETLLKKENIEKLKAILTYHVIAGDFTAAKIDAAIKKGHGTAKMKTLNGEELSFMMNEGKLVITDAKGGKATVEIADVMQSNGVIHSIDHVLMP